MSWSLPGPPCRTDASSPANSRSSPSPPLSSAATSTPGSMVMTSFPAPPSATIFVTPENSWWYPKASTATLPGVEPALTVKTSSPSVVSTEPRAAARGPMLSVSVSPVCDASTGGGVFSSPQPKLKSSSVTRARSKCLVSLKTEKPIVTNALNTPSSFPDTSNRHSGPREKFRRISSTRTLPSLFGSSRSMLMVAESPPPTPAEATTTSMAPNASMLACSTTSGTSSPVPSGLARSLTKKPSMRSAGLCESLNSFKPTVSYPKAKWILASTAPRRTMPRIPRSRIVGDM